MGVNYIIVNGKLVEVKILGGYTDLDGKEYHIIRWQNQNQPISADLVYNSKEEAEKSYIEQLEKSAKHNLDLAEKIKKDGMKIIDIEQPTKD